MIPDEPVMIAMSACIGCGRVFAFDPERVVSLRYVRQLGASLELALTRLDSLHAQHSMAYALVPGAQCPTCATIRKMLTDKAVSEPICPDCCRRANPERARLGFHRLSEEDTAQVRR